MLQKSNKWSWHIVVKNTLQHEWKQNLKCWWKCLHTPGACKDHITKKKKKKGVLKIKCLTFIWRPILMLGSSFKPEEWRHVIRVKKKNCNSWYENAPCLRDKPSTWVWKTDWHFFFFSFQIHQTHMQNMREEKIPATWAKTIPQHNDYKFYSTCLHVQINSNTNLDIRGRFFFPNKSTSTKNK